MSVAILDINDSNLHLWQSDAQVQSPGYALLEGKSYRFGNDARAAARLHPRQVNTRFWWQLNTQALQPALGPARHTADLVHSHLLDIHELGGKPDEVLLAVSSSLQRDQLALVLGIIQQCPFSAVGLVNRSVALGSLYGGPGKLFHLEIQLHQAVISELAEGNGKVELIRSVPLPGCGLLQLQERLVETIASGFIRQTRFDPRRKADTEQLLYDALPRALRELRGAPETNLEVNGYRARIVRAELESAGSRLCNSALETIGALGPGDRVILDPLATLLPGLQAQLPQAEALATDALPSAIRGHQDALLQRNEALNFITSLPCLAEPIAPSISAVAVESQPVETPVIEEVPSPPPTHLLQGAAARPLLSSGTPLEPSLELHCDSGRWLLRGDGLDKAKVNNAQARTGNALRPGDTIDSGTGNTFLLIEVKP